MTVYACCQSNRIAAVQDIPSINGIHFIEILDFEGQPPDERQRRIVMHFIHPLAAPLTPDNFIIEGGERVKNITVTNVETGTVPEVITLHTDKAGDFSLYTLRLVVNRDNDTSVPDGYDPRLASVEFSFKINCLQDFDCIEDVIRAQPVFNEPDISYLAKDYNSFVQLMLDRMAVTLPDWVERNPSDFGMMMVETLAYVGDQLSAFQDAVGTEAYLATARNRISVRRHCRLVDYFMHDGCNARTWVFLQAGAEEEVAAGTQLLTYIPGLSSSITRETLDDFTIKADDQPVIFETMYEVAINPAHNEIPFYTWGDSDCWLSVGATKATLLGEYPELSVGDVILLEEIRGIETGELADADPSKRHFVRLTHVELSEDPIGTAFADDFDPSTSTPAPVAVTEIEWDTQDALPFKLYISSSAVAGDAQNKISVARGNIVLADHGATLLTPVLPSVDFPAVTLPAGVKSVNGELLPPIPQPILIYPAVDNDCEDTPEKAVPVRYLPTLQERPITQAQEIWEQLDTIEGAVVTSIVNDLDANTLPTVLASRLSPGITAGTATVVVQRAGEAWLISAMSKRFYIRLEDTKIVIYPDMPPASTLLKQDLQQVMPSVLIREMTVALADGAVDPIIDWLPGKDLITASGTTRQFVVEIANDGTAYLRFGDDINGARPKPNDNDDVEKLMIAQYRIGNGRAGNIGAETLFHIIAQGDDALPITLVRNPIPAFGGTEPETIETARQNAPVAFRKRERAVTEQDYADITMRHPLVQGAVANFRWTGSWYTVFITVDLRGGQALTPAIEQQLISFIDNYRMAAHDLEIDEKIDVPLEIVMDVCVKANFSQRAVRDELLKRFGSGVLPDGTPGVFHPDNFTFGQTVYLSPLYAAAMEVEGIDSLNITVFQRQGQPETSGIDSGKIEIQRREIARLDNDPNFPTHGVFTLNMEGGR